MKKLIIILTAAVFAVSCSDNLEELNQNIKDPTAVTGESLFASAQKRLADQFTTPNVNLNNGRLWVQYLQETTYTDESNYDQVTRAIPDNHWRVMYRDVLKNLDEAHQIIEANDDPITMADNDNKLAIIEIMEVLAYSNLVETYGDIPYTEALDIDNLLPKYDDAFTVYKDLLQRLDNALGKLDPSNGSMATDNFYGGDVDSWKMFGNSLKLRMGMVLADVDPGLSVSTVNSAISGGVFTSNDDTAVYHYSAAAPNNNPMNDNLVLSGRNDYVAGKTIIDIMNDLEDPRRAAYFTTVDGEYIGGTIGKPSPYANSSHVADRLKEATEPGVVLSYIEVEFLLAEAAARGGYNVSGDAASHYDAGIKASFAYWGVEGVDDYLAKPEVDYNSALGMSTSEPKWKEVIGTQAWLALYNRTFASWLSVRRLDYPILTKPTSAESGFPVRYTYPANEQTLNPTNYNAAASAIGGDTPETRLFWDKYYTFDF